MTRQVVDGKVKMNNQTWTHPALAASGKPRVLVGLTDKGEPFATINGMDVLLELCADDDGATEEDNIRPLNLGPALTEGEKAGEGPSVDDLIEVGSTLRPEGASATEGQAEDGGPAFQPLARTPKVVGRLLYPGELSEDRGHVCRLRDVREVEVVLTPDELADVAKRQAVATDAWLLAKAQEEERHKAAMRPVKRMLAEVEELSAIHSSGKETRDLEVEVWADYEEGRLITVRTDTMEVIASVPLGVEDRQQRLPLKPRTPKPVEASTYTWEPGQDRQAEPAAEEPVEPPQAEGETAPEEPAGKTAAQARAEIVRWVAGQDEEIHRIWSDAGSVAQGKAVAALVLGEVSDAEAAFKWLNDLLDEIAGSNHYDPAVYDLKDEDEDPEPEEEEDNADSYDDGPRDDYEVG